MPFSTARPLMNTRWPPRVDRLTPALPMKPLIFSPASPAALDGGQFARRLLAVQIADAVEQPRAAGNWNTVRPSRTYTKRTAGCASASR